MVVHTRRRWSATLMYVVLGAWALIHFQLRAPGFVLAAAAVALVVVMQGMRLSADASGVTVVNLLRARHVEWPEIADFQLGSVALSTCIDVCKQDGTRVHAWVGTTTGFAAYKPELVFGMISDLRQRLMLANGWSQKDLDVRAMEHALSEADHGEYRHASSLVAEGRVDSQTMAETLVKRYKERRPGAD
jgi:hypothetical protein